MILCALLHTHTTALGYCVGCLPYCPEVEEWAEASGLQPHGQDCAKGCYSLMLFWGSSKESYFGELLLFTSVSPGFVFPCAMSSMVVGFMGIFLAKHSYRGNKPLNSYGVFQAVSLLTCGCIHKASALNRQGKREEEERDFWLYI